MNFVTILQVAGILALLDLFWIGTGGIYARALTEKIQGSPLQVRYLAAIPVYLFLAYMVLETTSDKQAFLYGVSIYGVYDFTTLALFSDYDWKFAIADTLWGGILFFLGRRAIKALL
jgi:uncharacterized membrane protein